jgi:hypothetical protein
MVHILTEEVKTHISNIASILDNVGEGVISEYTEGVVKTDLHFIYKVND